MKLDLITNKDVIDKDKNNNDEHYTPIYAIEPILKYLKPNSNILCPFDISDSNYVKIFEKNGHKVTFSHLETNKDFFTYTKEEIKDYDYIISNPPYSIKYEVFKHLFELGKPFAMLVGVVGLFESDKRFNLFKNNKFETMYFNRRISYYKSYSDEKTKLNPPFSSVYVTSNLLPNQIVFEIISKK